MEGESTNLYAFIEIRPGFISIADIHLRRSIADDTCLRIGRHCLNTHTHKSMFNCYGSQNPACIAPASTLYQPLSALDASSPGHNHDLKGYRMINLTPMTYGEFMRLNKPT